MFSRHQFPAAVSEVADWLAASDYHKAGAVRAVHYGSRAEWWLDLSGLGYPIQAVKISLNPEFPAAPCELFVDPKHCLALPHVEEDGRVCLATAPRPEDYVSPITAVAVALDQFSTQLLHKSNSPLWIEREFHQERASYWNRFNLQALEARGARPPPRVTFVDVPAVDSWMEGSIAAYVRTSSKRQRIAVQVVTSKDHDPDALAKRHSWAEGTFMRGSSIFIRLPEAQLWTPATWPQTFQEIVNLAHSATGGELSLETWLRSAASAVHEGPAGNNKVALGQQPLLVVFALGTELYGYQLSPPAVSIVETLHVTPIIIHRIDPQWIFARDHATAVVNQRLSKRVLLLGCGSLGCQVAEVLARSGVGKIDIVDMEIFDGPNISRHVLGMSAVRRGKAPSVAACITKEIPRIVVQGFAETAQRWVLEHCKPGKHDLVIDCTADSGVRQFLALNRDRLLGDVPVAHAWVEPFCSATHVVASMLDAPWPATDPVHPNVSAATYPASTKVQLPACSDGFHPYGSSDIMQAAGFCSERIISIIDRPLEVSTVWSYVRSQAFFDGLGVPGIETNPIVPSQGAPNDGISITRRLVDLLGKE
ncbi:E2 family protein B [Pseudoduganella namucuonensis]|uniref:E2 family protein B n=2 Tax=Pseudoduganella namucuonensis TaxID=1035707 RepID=A0A1I7HKC0_9BURK|nr:E2 family protein B [Pseudoduganella namucuonensis]